MKIDVKDLMTEAKIKLKPEEAIKEAVTMIADSKGSLVAYIVDNNDKLLGIITPRRILRQSFVEFGGSRQPSLEWVDLLSSMTSKTVGDIMGPPVSVKLDDQIEDIIEVMLDKNLYELPVLNKQGILLGEVRVSSIVTLWAQKLKAGQID